MALGQREIPRGSACPAEPLVTTANIFLPTKNDV